jgi:hypothetical protein
MPHTVEIKSKKVTITEETNSILDLYGESLNQLSPEQQTVLGISSEEVAKKGVIATLKAPLESLSGEKKGANECSFARLECNLTEFAFTLRESFLLFINKLIIQSGKNSKDTEKSPIESRHVLIYEILLRLVTVSLSDEENTKRSGNPFILVLESFIKKVLENQGLDKDFRYSLAESQAVWEGNFKQAIRIIQLIHLPVNAFTQLTNYLDKIKKVTKTYILAQFDVIKSGSEISDQWINTSYMNFIFGKQQNLLSSAENALELSLLQEEKLSHIKKHPHQEKIKEFFLLLNKTELLSDMIGRAESIVKASGWVLLLTGKLHFGSLVEYIREHKTLCCRYLDFSNSGLNREHRALGILMSRSWISGQKITEEVEEICERLTQLGSINHHQMVVKQFLGDVKDLMFYQERLGITFVNDVSDVQVVENARKKSVGSIEITALIEDTKSSTQKQDTKSISQPSNPQWKIIDEYRSSTEKVNHPDGLSNTNPKNKLPQKDNEIAAQKMTKTQEELLNTIGKEDNDSLCLGDNIWISRGEIKYTICDMNHYYTADVIHLLLLPISEIGSFAIRVYPTTTLEQLTNYFEAIVDQREGYAFMGLNIAYDKNEPKHKNHWVALIIDKNGQRIFYLDPAKKTTVPTDIENLRKKLGFQTTVIDNVIDFQEKEKEEGWMRHCGVYVIEIFRAFSKQIKNGKTIFADRMNSVMAVNGIALSAVLSEIAFWEAETAFLLRVNHIEEMLKNLKKTGLASSNQANSSIGHSETTNTLIFESVKVEALEEAPVKQAHQYPYTKYIQEFFSRYQDVDVRFTNALLSMENEFLERQRGMGSKDRALEKKEFSMSNMASSDNFLDVFNQDRFFLGASDFCKRVRTIVKEFEALHMEASTPKGLLFELFNRDKLWEGRHVELFYFKYLCVEVTKAKVSEEVLEAFVQWVITKSESKALSAYNHLKGALEVLMQSNVKVCRFLQLNSSQQQGSEIIRLRKENEQLLKENARLKIESRKKDKLIEEKDDENKRILIQNQEILKQLQRQAEESKEDREESKKKDQEAKKEREQTQKLINFLMTREQQTKPATGESSQANINNSSQTQTNTATYQPVFRQNQTRDTNTQESEEKNNFCLLL